MRLGEGPAVVNRARLKYGRENRIIRSVGIEMIRKAPRINRLVEAFAVFRTRVEKARCRRCAERFWAG